MKLSTRQKIVRLRAKDPNMSATDIAKLVGVSKERVGQLLVKLGLPTAVSRRGAKRECQ